MTKRKKVVRDEAVDLPLIPQALRRVRQTAGLRQVDVAEKSGLSKAMVSAYEGGKALPSLASLSAYLGAIGRDLGDLQDALTHLRGRLHEGTLVDRERVVGRAVLNALRMLEDSSP